MAANWRKLNAMLIGASCVVAASAFGADKEPKPTSFFISLDGLQPAHLERMAEDNILQAPRGLGWLFGASARAPRANTIVTTLTAPSHVSTITCSEPADHGIVANSFQRDGEELNGFMTPFTSEPMWRSAMRQGKSVLAIAYVGADGSSSQRTATAGLAYPDYSLLGARATYNWKMSELEEAKGWTGRVIHADSREVSFQVVLNPKTKERRQLYALLQPRPDGLLDVLIDDDKRLDNGTIGSLDPSNQSLVVNAYFKERHEDSELRGYLRRTFFRIMKAEPGAVTVYRSRVSYNRAYPAAFRKLLADRKLVWPDYGLRGDVPLMEKIEAQAMIDRHLVEVAKVAMGWQHFDIVLGYQPLLDTMGHRYQEKLGDDLRPVNDEVRAYRRAYQIVDQNMSKLFSLSAGEPTIAVMGDHGMDEILFGVNIAKLIPKHHFDNVTVMTGGSMALLYPKDPKNKEHVGSAMAAGQVVADQLQKLRAAPPTEAGVARQAERPVLDEARKRTEKRWHYGEAEWAFLSAVGVEMGFSPFEDELILPPGISGTHGREPTHQDMATTFLFYRPGIKAQLLKPMSLLDAVPTFSAALGIKPPKDCRGTALAIAK